MFGKELKKNTDSEKNGIDSEKIKYSMPWDY